MLRGQPGDGVIWLLLYPLAGAVLFAGIVWHQTAQRDVELGEFAWGLVALLTGWPLIAAVMLLDQLEGYGPLSKRVFIKRRRG